MIGTLVCVEEYTISEVLDEHTKDKVLNSPVVEYFNPCTFSFGISKATYIGGVNPEMVFHTPEENTVYLPKDDLNPETSLEIGNQDCHFCGENTGFSFINKATIHSNESESEIPSEIRQAPQLECADNTYEIAGEKTTHVCSDCVQIISLLRDKVFAEHSQDIISLTI